MNNSIATICHTRYKYLKDNRKQQVKRLKHCVRAIKLKTVFDSHLQKNADNITSDCIDDLLEKVSSSSSQKEHQTKQNISETLLKVVSKKREYVINYIAKYQLMNTKNSVLRYIKNRFMKYKRNLQLSETVQWVRDMPVKLNYNSNNNMFTENLSLNDEQLRTLYSNTFSNLLFESEILKDHKVYVYKIARSLNRLVYPINAIDWAEFNSLMFLLRIYKKQDYDFDSMLDEITSNEVLPTPDTAVLHDNVLPLFRRINYFDYNDFTGDIKESFDNALFLFRTEIYPFLVCEYLLIRFVLKYTSPSVRHAVKEEINRAFSYNKVIKNIVQIFPGVFTILYILYFQSSGETDPKGILNILIDIKSAAASGNNETVTSHMKQITTFICEIIFKIEQEEMYLTDEWCKRLLNDLSFLRYNFFLKHTYKSNSRLSLDTLPGLSR